VISSVSGRLRDQNAAVAAGAGDDPGRAAIAKFPTLRDLRVRSKHQHLGRGPRVGNDNRHSTLPRLRQTGSVVRGKVQSLENSWSQVSVLISIDGKSRQKVH